MGLDESLAAALAQAPWGGLAPAAQAFSLLGTTAAWWALALLFALRRKWHVALPLALALLATDPAVSALKGLFERPRPFPLLDPEFAFPSGHAARAAAGAVVLALQAQPRWARAGAVAFAAAMGAARLLAQAHWLTDVLAGLALGALIGFLAVLAWRRDWARLRTRALRALAREPAPAP